MTPHPKIFRAAAVLGLIAVVLGAFGAHGLSGKISDNLLDAWKTAVQYKFYHVFALLFISQLSVGDTSKWLDRAFVFFVSGIILFSGSLYTLAILDLFSLHLKFVGILTPIGGLFFIAGWLSLIMARTAK